MKKKKSDELSLSGLLSGKKFPAETEASVKSEIKKLQLKMLRIQQGIWQAKRRAIIIFEGFDAAGKGGTIRALTEKLDPRGLRVHPMGPPSSTSQGKHYLYRFWRKLPSPGSCAIFDRSWYGRVLVERVEKLASKERWQEAYLEINEFEATLLRDGIDLVKIFLAIHPAEQIKRFEDRLNDPYKQWKLTKADIEAHQNWDKYVRAADEMFAKTHQPGSPWHLIPADSKDYARRETLSIITKSLSHHKEWLEGVQMKEDHNDLARALEKLKS